MVLFELLSREITAAAILRNARRQDPELCELYAHKARPFCSFHVKGNQRIVRRVRLLMHLSGGMYAIQPSVPTCLRMHGRISGTCIKQLLGGNTCCVNSHCKSLR